MIELQNYSIPRIVISGLRGGSGKTILSLSLAAFLARKGYQVTPFKKGPDYIDAGWLAKASGASCFNLDLFMMSPEQAMQSFISHSLNAELKSEIRNPKSEINRFPDHIAIIEGNRGLFDGVDHTGTYSTAELAKLLKAPVLIIIDCTKATNTIAAMVLGCQQMDTDVSIGGVVLNQIATGRQEAVIRKAIEGRCNAPVVGAIPRLKKDPFPERHMGLTPFHEHGDIEKSLDIVAEIGEKYLDVEAILKIANQTSPMGREEVQKAGRPEGRKAGRQAGRRADFTSLSHSMPSSLRIGVIRDTAFQFYYQENFEELEKRGATLVEVSPLREDSLPDIDALYIGGGFPETHAIALAENVRFKESLNSAIEEGLPVYAECGGLMYLGRGLVLQDRTYSMAGVFPIVFGMDSKPQAHGYTVVEVEKANPYYPLGTVLKGHEFHYSRILEIDIDNENTLMAFSMKRGKGISDGKDGICYRNVFATYTHLHAIGSPEWADGMIKCASEINRRKK